MPTYGYECVSCKDHFEVMQSIKDDPLTICTACGGTLRKRVYPVGIAFKGSGFYVNDYGNSVPKSDSAAPESKGEAKTEAAKAESPAPAAPKADTKTEAPAAA